ncbi:MAG TPA: SAM-dependent methyltransferase [Microbacteriaceae bacterium]|nr:SAM-dependent methyltransferase [Microbacteriaceae bacterium]
MTLPDLDVLLDAATLRLIDELGPIASTSEAVAAITRLRRSGVSAERAGAALSQARLRAKAVAKFGDFAARMLFTEDGLQQATRLGVAARHAARYRDAGLRTVADLGCGIGGDALAFAGLDLAVRAVERDPITAAIAAYNLAAFPDVEVTVSSAEDAELSGVDGVWLDPARRDGARRLSDPGDWSPSLGFAFGLELPTGVKLGPGIDRGLIPSGWEAQWVSDGGEVVEVAVWSGPLARPGVGRAALVLSASGAHELTAPADSEDVAVGELGEYLVEPDGAVIRARLIGDLARRLSPDARMLHSTIAYVTLDAPPDTAFGRSFRVLDVLPLDAKAVRRALAERGASSVEIKKRGVDIEPEAFRKLLKLRAGETAPRELTVILTRLGDRRRAILCERLGIE